ncbi:hypothetical protein ACFLVN_03620 [Chloroflexota bacterium]
MCSKGTIGREEQFTKITNDERLPLGAKYERKLVEAWETHVDPHIPKEIIDLWVYDDLAHMERRRVKSISIISGETLEVIVPLPNDGLLETLTAKVPEI